jgi:Tfp pilus assembly protein PilV
MTLIEALIGLVIMSILLASLLSFFAKGQRDFFRGNVRSDVLDKARYPLSWIGRDVNVAQLVDWKHEEIWASGAVLILQLPCLDVNGYVINDIHQWDHIVYSVTNNRLTRHCHPHPSSYRQAGDKVLADNVAGLAITYYDATENILTSGYTAAVAVKAEVTVSTNVGSRNFRQALSSRFTLRNKAT